MKNKKIYIIIISIILVICLLTIIYFTNNKNNKVEESDKKNNNLITTTKEAEDYIKTITDIVINDGNKEELTKTLKTNQFKDSYIMTGEDMYLLQKPDDKIISKYALEEYVKKSKMLKNNLEKYIKEDFQYKINGISKSDKYTSANITYKTYYYTSYLNDLSQIQVALLEKTGYFLEEFTENEQFIADSYKAKIKAATILDSYLNLYSNKSEFKNTIVSYINNDIEDSSEEFLSYLINLTGYTYDYVGILTTYKDIDSFLSNYDLSKPLEL